MGTSKLSKSLFEMELKLTKYVSTEYGSALHQAASGGHTDVVKILLAHGCPIDIVDCYQSYCTNVGYRREKPSNRVKK